MTNTDVSHKKAPIFGVISLILPILGVPIAYLVLVVLSMFFEVDSLVMFANFIIIAFFILIFGLVSAGIGLFRRESFLVFTLLGLLLNLCPIIWAFCHHH